MIGDLVHVIEKAVHVIEDVFQVFGYAVYVIEATFAWSGMLFM